MKLKFKVQSFQTNAVESVVDCFSGQVNTSKVAYRMDPGASTLEYTGFKNADIQATESQMLEKIRGVQRRQNLTVSSELVASAGCKFNLDVEMETGTGKTYCYIKTFFEMNKLYGWSKFIVVVPSIAIREGVLKSLDITAEHFAENYGKKARFFAYNSRQLHHLENFSSDAGINVMVINIQAFNATGKDNRRIYDELDDFQSRKPIDVISSNRPILVLDEPQKMEGDKTMKALAKFKPLMILRYSATHKTNHNKIHRLDALDAYNHKLVKKIAVRGITTQGLAGINCYLYLEAVENSATSVLARMEYEKKMAGGEIKRVVRKFSVRDNLYELSGGLDQYKGLVISQIYVKQDIVEFTGGKTLFAGQASGDITEAAMRQIQIREAIRAHLEKERKLFRLGIKTLSLFFIDQVAKYRDYKQEEDKGEYARMFEEEYERLKNEILSELLPEDKAYREYLDGIDVKATHNGYFSIDKKSKHFVDSDAKGKEKASDDVDAYDLILKDKERLLSFDEPTRFIFSHSALREGWDNPNVFVMGMLKHSDNTVSRRQEVGRGLRLSVDQTGERMDDPATVHDINVLTVVASEGYKDFVKGLQSEIQKSLSERPRKAEAEYFIDKNIQLEDGSVHTLTETEAKKLERYLIKADYIDDDMKVTETYRDAKNNETLVQLPGELAKLGVGIFALVDSVDNDTQLLLVGDDRKPKKNRLNENFEKAEFKALWEKINKKAIYRVEFDSDELIGKCIPVLERHLKVTPLQYIIERGQQKAIMSRDGLKDGQEFDNPDSVRESHQASAYSEVKYDLLGKLAEGTKLTRKTIAAILTGIQEVVFNQFKQNPEDFISQAARLINEQKATVIIEQLTYDELSEKYDTSIFTAEEKRIDLTRAIGVLKKHAFDFAVCDSNVEKDFVKALDGAEEVQVYTKLPGGFHIPTPVGNYNPDWAISFKDGSVKHVCFVAETKGSMSSMQLKLIEKKKIDCAQKFFEKINQGINKGKVKYDVVSSFGKLMELVS